ncbi:trypsin-like peptidase domain-containing protein [Sporomusa acidovorans]|uniref:Serine protease HhoB n=1 Tax=Sporomusa acidovorans (strain ATCC 49682 / DSM 3132 / Mol) TaxID=1123286 RepID=A0ABZ3JBR6_SPOA4|nr:trypsin-like peptidase domain-containing protein [Sporomusa acidovorans]OZC13200.1 putative serine protease HhoB precursor [Sporomusa acidovorans DSM 3132]SDE01413.1 Do/DeqQ family serine protease [Sporomusa acidovorans]
MKHNKKSLVSIVLLMVLTGFFTAGLVLGAGVSSAEAAQNMGIASPSVFLGPDTIQTIVKQTGPAVVKIETEMQVQNQGNPFLNDPFFREFFGEQFKRQPGVAKSLGSGFITSKDGYIITNNHVIANATKIDVYLTSRKEPYAAKLIGSDEQLDLAVLKIDAGDNLPSLEFGDSNKLEVGSWVIAIGNPYGLDHTVTVGVISAKGRPLTINGSQFTDLLQTDASINPGNSGGPLINLQGEVIGINTAISAQAQGIGFAIPSSTVTQVLDQLMNNGKVIRPWLGIYMQPMTKELANYFGLQEPEGVLVSAVVDGSPAQKAGLKRGDIVLEYNKKKVKDPDALKKEVANAKIGEDVVVLIHRDGKTLFVPVKIEEK